METVYNMFGYQPKKESKQKSEYQSQRIQQTQGLSLKPITSESSDEEELYKYKVANRIAQKLEKEKKEKIDVKKKCIYTVALTYGYQITKYKYTTSDGYINTVFRLTRQESQELKEQEVMDHNGNLFKISPEFIPKLKKKRNTIETKIDIWSHVQKNGRRNLKPSRRHKPVVICQHGILDSAACWILNGERSIGFRLVDEGYDVWLNNSRGSWYSSEHVNYDLNSKVSKKDNIRKQRKKYYDFSFHEMGIYDQPALWNFVLAETKQKSASFVCHSQGFTQMYVSMMAYPNFYKQNMKICVAFAPVTTFSHHKVEIMRLLGENKLLAKLIKSQCPQILSRSVTSQPIINHLYKASKMSNSHTLPLSMVIEENPGDVTQEALDNYTNHFPAGGSYKQIDHYRQMMITKEFKMYDYMFQKSKKKENENIARYGQETPPSYPTENIKNLPIALVCGKCDKICQPGDYLVLKEMLEKQGSLVDFIETGFGHMSLLNPNYAESMKRQQSKEEPQDHIDLVFDKILKPAFKKDGPKLVPEKGKQFVENPNFNLYF